MAFSPSTIMVTGCNRGLGLEFIKKLVCLSPAPKQIFATCRKPDEAKDLKELADKHKSITIVQLDLLDMDSIAAAARTVTEKLGDQGLNVLLNNSGVLVYQTLDDTTPEAMMEQYRVNTVGPLMLTKAFLPLLRQAVKSSSLKTMSINRSAIINMSTGLASITDNSSGGIYPYRSSKAGLNMVSKNLSIDLKKDGILVTAIHPGWVKTDLGGKNAQLTTDKSVTEMLKVLAKCQNEESSGKFYSWSGKEEPY